MNIKLFNKVKAYITAHPRELVMDYFNNFINKEFKKEHTDYANHPLTRLSCGTVGCIAGTGILCSISESKRPKTQAEYDLFTAQKFDSLDNEEAAKLFDIPSSEAEALFYFPFKAQARQALNGYEIAIAYSDVRKRLKKAIPGTKKYAGIVLEAIDICIDRCREKKVVTIVPALTYQEVV